MKDKQKKIGKLTVCKETLLNLDRLKVVVGGIPPTFREATCISCQDTCVYCYTYFC